MTQQQIITGLIDGLAKRDTIATAEPIQHSTFFILRNDAMPACIVVVNVAPDAPYNAIAYVTSDGSTATGSTSAIESAHFLKNLSDALNGF